MTDKQFGLTGKKMEVYDMETLTKMWQFYFEPADEEKVDGTFIRNDTSGRIMLLRSICNNKHLVGWNSNNYDDPMITNIASEGLSVEEVKDLNDRIIVDGERVKKTINLTSTDLYTYVGMGLKMVEAVNGANIKEFHIDGYENAFEVERDLTPEEQAIMDEYNKYDVRYTKKVLHAVQPDMELKAELLDYVESYVPSLNRNYFWSQSMGTISRQMFEGFYGRDDIIIPYTPLNAPDTDLTKTLPKECFMFFEKGGEWAWENRDQFGDGYDVVRQKIPRVDKYKYFLEFHIGNAHVRQSDGGFHGADKSQIKYDNTVFKDVEALYPRVMINYNLLNDHTEILDNLVKQRVVYKDKAKEYWDKYVETDELYNLVKFKKYDRTQKARKLIVNSLYGLLGMRSEYNPLYCPNTRSSVCWIGQISLMDLAYRMVGVGAFLINLNTDGIAYSQDPKLYPVGTDMKQLVKDVDRIADEWAEDWGFKLDDDVFEYIIQANVNNYFGTDVKGKTKAKGGALSGKNALDTLSKGEMLFNPMAFAGVSLCVYNILNKSVEWKYEDLVKTAREEIEQIWNEYGIKAFVTNQNLGKTYDHYTVDLDKNKLCPDLDGNYYPTGKVMRFINVNPKKFDTVAVRKVQYELDDDGEYIWLNDVTRKSVARLVTNTKNSTVSCNGDLENYDIEFDDLDVDIYVESAVHKLIKNWKIKVEDLPKNW